MGLLDIQRPVSDCNKPIIKIEAYSDCFDNITSEYYGTGFRKVLNLKGFIKSVPRETERTISFNCRTQRVRSSRIYNIQGADLYPEWKKNELEDMFSLKTIVIDGFEIVYRGGTMFEEANKGCPKLYRLSINVEECTRQQIHGCGDTCAPVNQLVFLIPERQTNDLYFNAGGQQIASSFAMLMNWYLAQTGVTEVAEIAAQVDCLYYKVFRVSGTSVIPSIFYFDAATNSNKVIGKIVSDANMNDLCNGVNNYMCGTLMIGTPTVYEMECGIITIGTPTIYIIGESCGIELMGNWEQFTGDTEIIAVGSNKTLSLSVFNEDYIVPAGPSPGAPFTYTSTVQSLCAIPTTIPLDATIVLVRRNGIVQTGGQYSFNTTTGVLTLTNCLDTGDTVEVNFSFSGYPTLSNELIGIITGTNCQSNQIYSFNHYNNSQIPLGATLALYPNGEIRWTGPVTNADNTQSEIEVTNIIYQSY